MWSRPYTWPSGVPWPKNFTGQPAPERAMQPSRLRASGRGGHLPSSLHRSRFDRWNFGKFYHQRMVLPMKNHISRLCLNAVQNSTVLVVSQAGLNDVALCRHQHRCTCSQTLRLFFVDLSGSRIDSDFIHISRHPDGYQFVPDVRQNGFGIPLFRRSTPPPPPAMMRK